MTQFLLVILIIVVIFVILEKLLKINVFEWALEGCSFIFIFGPVFLLLIGVGVFIVYAFYQTVGSTAAIIVVLIFTSLAFWVYYSDKK